MDIRPGLPTLPSLHSSWPGCGRAFGRNGGV